MCPSVPVFFYILFCRSRVFLVMYKRVSVFSGYVDKRDFGSFLPKIVFPPLVFLRLIRIRGSLHQYGGTHVRVYFMQ